jgi:phosphoglycolate phosphatase-like HAD superfamily hydrolase
MTTRCYIFDMDGTLTDTTHRQHLVRGPEKNFPAFEQSSHLDPPHAHIVELALILKKAGHVTVFVSARSEDVAMHTLLWLQEQGLEGPLYMRNAGDNRGDEIVKLELLAELRADGYEPIMVFDDRSKVVAMWRAAGIPCAQVAEGNF